MSSAPSPIRPLADLLHKKQPLSSLLAKADALLRLEQLLHAQLAPAVRAFCKVASFRDGRLLLVVSNGQWATHLRYQERRLCQALQVLPEFAGISRIVLKVQPLLVQSQGRGSCPPLPAKAAESLHACAKDCNDRALQNALKKLAKHAEK
ncbi:hypothetical protein AXE65_04475 [Ventosimonas gracilis]|uniref:RNA-binding protein n=1 Tax=Ventosimonas gracilis TaxID=1680762 RepID=A0A139SQT5_9GAMM|nr:DUF721 domain-containing protein [Ventosimonas gracilis]KXU36902.1 hypothetical protein AXE65_04475 [Ventosimonas gracilis]